MAIVENQMVEVKWSNANRKRYEELGYTFTRINDTFLVNVYDLSSSSNKVVKVECDNCGNIYSRKYTKLNQSNTHCCSSKCFGEIAKKSGSNKIYSKESLVNYFHKYTEEFGHYPRIKDFNKANGYPSEIAYKYYWNSYDDCLKEINIVAEDTTDGWYIHDEEVLRNHYEYDSKEIIIEKLMVKRGWDTIKKKASKLGLSRKASRSPFTKMELIDKLNEFYNKTNRLPKSDDCRTNGLPSIKVFTNHFGSWNNALKQSGLSLNTDFDIRKEEIENRALKFYEEHNRSPYCHEILKSRTPLFKYWDSFDECLESIGLPLNRKKRNPKIKTDDELLHDYKELYIAMGRIPLANDIDSCDDLASFSTYIKRFNTYENIWSLCGIEQPLKILKKSRYGSICLDKNGEICKSFAEMVVTNLLIDNNINYIKELNYKELFPDYKGKTLVMDWYLPDYNICVEYFGLYNERQSDDVSNKYRGKTKKKIEIFSDSSISLIDIYQQDLNEIYLNRLVEKFKVHSIELVVGEKNLYKNRKIQSSIS